MICILKSTFYVRISIVTSFILLTLGDLFFRSKAIFGKVKKDKFDNNLNRFALVVTHSACATKSELGCVSTWFYTFMHRQNLFAARAFAEEPSVCSAMPSLHAFFVIIFRSHFPVCHLWLPLPAPWHFANQSFNLWSLPKFSRFYRLDLMCFQESSSDSPKPFYWISFVIYCSFLIIRRWTVFGPFETFLLATIRSQGTFLVKKQGLELTLLNLNQSIECVCANVWWSYSSNIRAKLYKHTQQYQIYFSFKSS